MWYMVCGIWYLAYKHKDPTFLVSSSSWALEPTCKILMFVWSFGHLILLVLEKYIRKIAITSES